MNTASPDLARAPKVLFFSHDGKLGDSIVNTAFVAALKRWKPECEIHTTGGGATSAFWAADDRIDGLWPLQRRGWADILRTGLALRRERFDYIVTWRRTRSEKNRMLLWLAAPGKVIDLHDFNQGPVRHKIDACAAALAQIGCREPAPLAYELRMAPRCEDIDARFPPPRELILLNLFAADCERTIGHDIALELADGLMRAAPGALLCLLCSAATEAQARAVRDACGAGELVNCEGDLARLLRICQRADVIISPDTAVVHIACALQTPVVGIYQNDDIKPVQWRPRGAETAVVRSSSATTLDGFDLDEVISHAIRLSRRRAAGLAPEPLLVAA